MFFLTRDHWVIGGSGENRMEVRETLCFWDTSLGWMEEMGLYIVYAVYLIHTSYSSQESHGNLILLAIFGLYPPPHSLPPTQPSSLSSLSLSTKSQSHSALFPSFPP